MQKQLTVILAPIWNRWEFYTEVGQPHPQKNHPEIGVPINCISTTQGEKQPINFFLGIEVHSEEKMHANGFCLLAQNLTSLIHLFCTG